MIDTKELRRLAQAASPGPWKVGQYLGSPRQFVIHMDVGDKGRGSDVAFTSAAFGNDETVSNARFIAAANPATVSELLDRLEAAEKERDALRAEVIHIKEVEFPRKAQAVADGWRGKCERLEAKIAEMKRQEPVAWMTKLALEFGASRLVFQVSDVNIWGENGVPLYALPGAKGEMK